MNYSDTELLNKIIKIAYENESNSAWPSHLKPNNIRDQADKIYSVWNSIFVSFANVGRNGYWDTTQTISGDRRIVYTTKFVVDKLNVPLLITNYREYLEKTYNDVCYLKGLIENNERELRELELSNLKAEKLKSKWCNFLLSYLNSFLMLIFSF